MQRPPVSIALLPLVCSLAGASACAPTVGAGSTDDGVTTVGAAGSTDASSTGEGCEGLAPDCAWEDDCFPQVGPAICQFGQWECPHAALPDDQGFRCLPDTHTFSGSGESSGGGSDSGTGDPPQGGVVDVVMVVDNSAGTGGMQRTLAQASGSLLESLELAGFSDVHVMVTSTDVGNPHCDPFAPEDYTALSGAPAVGPCTDRLHWFDEGADEGDGEHVCLDVCTDADTVAGPFLSVVDGRSNASGSAAAALACLIPQGVRGCGFESPLEALLQTLNPDACWNTPGGCSGHDESFLRGDAALLAVVVTDEGDCSVADLSQMQNPQLQSVDPATGQPALTSAWCSNAALACEDGSCALREQSPLHGVDRYADALHELRDEGKRVEIAVLAGRDDGSRWRAWTPADLFDDEVEAGLTTETAAFTWGLAPSCKDDERRVRALPTPRLQAALCDEVACHHASACTPDYATVLAVAAASL